MWYNQKPTVYKSLTGADAKPAASHAFGARVGANIGKMVGVSATPKARAQSAASNSQDYVCRQCGYTTKMKMVKRDMVTHLGREANKQCLDLYSESKDKRDEVWVQMVRDAVGPAVYLCRQCVYTTRKTDANRNMVRHLRRAENKKCLELYSDSIDTRDMDWVRSVQERQCAVAQLPSSTSNALCF